MNDVYVFPLSLQNICEAKVHLHKVMTLCVTS